MDDESRDTDDLPEGWVEMGSSWVLAVRWERGPEELHVRTKSKDYGPSACSPQQFRELLSAPSKGTWVNEFWRR